MSNYVIATIDSNKFISETTPFISDEQLQRVMIEARKKNCRVKIMSSADARYHRDYKKQVAI